MIKLKADNKISFKKKLIVLSVSIFLTLCLLVISYKGSRAATGVTKMLTYQGKLTNSDGSPVVDGNYNMIISIYDASSGGSRLWTWNGTTGSPTAVSVAVSNGIFNVVLGDTATYVGTNALNLDFNADTYYLGVTVGGDAEMGRIRIGASGYGINAYSLDGNNVASVAAQGDILYGSATGIFSTLAKDTNTTRYLSNTGTSNNPAWAQINLTNGVSGALPIANGGSNATTASGARTNLGAAQSGWNSDITSLTGLNQQESLRLSPYGSSAGQTAQIRFRELAANGTDYVGFKAPDSIASPKIWTLPNADGSNGNLLSTDGSGNLSWSSSTKQLAENFTVDVGQSITAGDVVSMINNSGAKLRKGFDYATYGSSNVFTSAGMVQYISAAALSSTKFVVTFEDNGNGFKGTAIIGTVSGTTISYGSKYVFETFTTNYSSVAALSSDKFVVTYRYSSTAGKAIIGTVSGTTISYGSSYTFNAADTQYTSVAALSSDKFAVAYSNLGNSGYGTAIIGTISGTTISYGSSYVYNSDAMTAYISAITLSSTKFVIANADASSSHGQTYIATVSGTTISFGSKYTFSSTTTYYIAAAALSSDKFVIAFDDYGNSNYGTAIIGKVCGTTISYGSKYAFGSGTDQMITAATLSSDKFMVAYRENSASAKSNIGTVSGTTISYSSSSVFDSANTSYNAAAALSSDKFVIAYADGGNSYYGTAIVGQPVPAIGIAKNTAAAGATCTVIIKGLSDAHSALTVGATYYATPNGSLTTTEYPDRVGICTASTDIILDGKWTSQDDVFADLEFKNGFRIIESKDNGQGLSFLNQNSNQIASLNEEGNLSVTGLLKAGGLNIGENALVIGANNNVGIGTANPTAKLDIAGQTGYDQLRLQKSFTPHGQYDPAGNSGDIAWDDNYLYVKTEKGWNRYKLNNISK